jgi:UPF0755 protein
MIRGILGFLVLTGTIAAAAGYIGLRTLVTIPGPLPEDAIVYIAPGTSVAAMGRQLQDIGAVDHALVFRAAAFFARGRGPLQAGEYRLEDAASPAAIVALLQSGKTYARTLTVPEGLMAVEIVALVNAAEAMTGEVTAVPPEGALLPETYHYRRGDSRQALVNRMQKAMTDTLAELWPQRAEHTPVMSAGDAVILASIVEKETGIAAERAKVAGVFANRLKAGMPLQSDPTTIYALTEGRQRLDRPLLRKDLGLASPYNTYAVAGLPPGPIANPGRLSLQAVLAPEKHDFFYFVADGTGGHAFARTLAEHNANVAKWRQVQRGQRPAATVPAE